MQRVLYFVLFCFFAAVSTALAVDGDPILEPLTIDKIESTDLSGLDGTLITGTAGTSTYAAVWDGNGDLIDGPGVPAITNLSNISSTAIPVSLLSDTALTDSLGSEALPWLKAWLGSEISFEGSSDDAYRTTLSVTNPTGTRTITIPDSDQTIGVATSAAADAIDAITEIAAALRTGSDTQICTGTPGASGNLAAWNADGDLVDGGSASSNPGSFGAETAKTISGGVADASGGENWLGLAGEGAAADDLTELQCAAVGDIIVLSNPNAGSYTITIKKGTYIKSQADFSLDNVNDIFTVICSSVGANDTVRELSRANNS